MKPTEKPFTPPDELCARVDALLASHERNMRADREREEREAAQKAAAEAERKERFAKREANWQRRQAKWEQERAAYAASHPPHPAAVDRSWMQGEDYCGITCGNCGKTSNAAKWYNDALGFPRPTDELQCPACGYAVRRTCTGGIVKLEPIQPSLA